MMTDHLSAEEAIATLRTQQEALRTRQDALRTQQDALRTQQDALRQAGILPLSLFGSMARRVAGPDSDVDLV